MVANVPVATSGQVLVQAVDERPPDANTWYIAVVFGCYCIRCGYGACDEACHDRIGIRRTRTRKPGSLFEEEALTTIGRQRTVAQKLLSYCICSSLKSAVPDTFAKPVPCSHLRLKLFTVLSTY